MEFYFWSCVDDILVACRSIQTSFWEIIAYEQDDFKFLEGHGFNILIQKYVSEEWKQIYSLVLEAKQQKAIHLPSYSE